MESPQRTKEKNVEPTPISEPQQTVLPTGQQQASPQSIPQKTPAVIDKDFVIPPSMQL